MNTTEMVQIALDLAQLQELPLDSSVTVPGENITRVLAGIDMGAAELTLARQLGYDCVARHHNMVPRLGKLGELVAQSHYEKLVHYGVPVNVAQKLLEHRKRATEIMFHGSNLDGGPSVARLLGMPYLGLHTPADLLGERMVEAKVDEVYEANDNPTVQEILDNLMTIREYAQAPEGQRPAIWVGEKDSYAGKTVVDFAGGLGCFGSLFDGPVAALVLAVGQAGDACGDRCLYQSPAGGQPLQRAVHGSHGQRLHWL